MNIHVKTLTTRFLTRDRGTEAFNNLAQLEYDSITIDLNSIQLLSYSFLDEIVLRASRAGRLKDITFKTDDESVLDKLAHISGTRHVDIVVNSATLKIQRLEPMTFTRQSAVFAGAKGKENQTGEENQTDN